MLRSGIQLPGHSKLSLKVTSAVIIAVKSHVVSLGLR
jgi:hypothetical protein